MARLCAVNLKKKRFRIIGCGFFRLSKSVNAFYSFAVFSRVTCTAKFTKGCDLILYWLFTLIFPGQISYSVFVLCLNWIDRNFQQLTWVWIKSVFVSYFNLKSKSYTFLPQFCFNCHQEVELHKTKTLTKSIFTCRNNTHYINHTLIYFSAT